MVGRGIRSSLKAKGEREGEIFVWFGFGPWEMFNGGRIPVSFRPRRCGMCVEGEVK